MTTLPIASDCHHDWGVTPWQRLGHLVLARRLELKHRTRESLAASAGISPRTLGDIEKGRKESYDRSTIVSLENALGWTLGSIKAIVEGGGPELRDAPGEPTGTVSPADEALVRVMSSDLPEDAKERLMAMLIQERDEADRRRVERAQQMINLLGGSTPENGAEA